MFFSKFVENLYRSTLFTRHDDDGAVFYFSVEDFPGLNRLPYSFVTKSGHKLQGYFYSYGDPIPERLVVFDHGMGSGHRAYLKEIEMLARHGYLVFSYDHTGCTESEGESVRGFAGSLADLDSCISALRGDDKYRDMKISVVGHSWGAFSALNISALHPDISHIIAISGFVSVKEMQKQVIPAPFAVFRKKLFAIEEAANPDYVNFSAVETIRNTSSKVLIIHSSDDKTVSARRHFSAIRREFGEKDNVDFLLVEGKDHNPNYTVDAVKYKNEFFKTLSAKRKAGELSTEKAKSDFKASYDWERMTEQDEDIWNEIFKALDN